MHNKSYLTEQQNVPEQKIYISIVRFKDGDSTLSLVEIFFKVVEK